MMDGGIPLPLGHRNKMTRSRFDIVPASHGDERSEEAMQVPASSRRLWDRMLDLISKNGVELGARLCMNAPQLSPDEDWIVEGPIGWCDRGERKHGQR